MGMRRFESRAALHPVRGARFSPDIGALLFKLCRCRRKPPLGELPFQTLYAPTARKKLRLEPTLFQHPDRARGQHLVTFNGRIGAAMSGGHNLAPPGCEMSSLRAFTEIHLQAFFT